MYLEITKKSQYALQKNAKHVFIELKKNHITTFMPHGKT